MGHEPQTRGEGQKKSFGRLFSQILSFVFSFEKMREIFSEYSPNISRILLHSFAFFNVSIAFLLNILILIISGI